jgi:hypothetical protein
MRTLLPVFAKYCVALNLDAKEPMENFSFMGEPNEYETFRECLDNIPGSRHYLKTYKLSDNRPFRDDMGYAILCGAGSHHSGASSTSLALQYKFLLNDWDSWVKAMKVSAAKDAYKEAQLELKDTWSFTRAETFDMTTKAIQTLRTNFSLNLSDQEITERMLELIAEFHENSRLNQLAYDQKHFEGRLALLEHHYKYPARWDDNGVGSLVSSLFGSIHSITEEMIVEMEKRIPYYRSHIDNLRNPHMPLCACGICDKKRIANGTDAEYSAWVHAEAAAVLSRPPRSNV